MLARHLRRARTGGAGASCVHRRCYSSEQWSRLESKAMAIVQGLEQQGQTVGVAELASGGLISAGDCRRSNLSPPATSPDPGPTLAPTVFLASSVDVAFRTPVLQGRRRAAGLRHQSRRRPAGSRARAQLRRGEDELWRRRHVRQKRALLGRHAPPARPSVRGLSKLRAASGRPEDEIWPPAPWGVT